MWWRIIPQMRDIAPHIRKQNLPPKNVGNVDSAVLFCLSRQKLARANPVAVGNFKRLRAAGAARSDPGRCTLTLDEVDSVIAYLQARIIGRGKITREECLSYYEDQPDTCEDYK